MSSLVLELTATDRNGKSSSFRVPFLQDDEGVEKQVVNLYPEQEFQTIEGFGGAVTDASGYVYSLMDDGQRREVIETYFSPERMRYGLVRVHMDSCDFSTGMYEAMSDPTDRELKSFSFARTEQYILPMLSDAQQAAGKPLELMLSAWSPPAFMKTNGQRTGGGKLKPEYRDFWADYICRYIEEFRKRGFHVRRISVQNEPKAVQTWDSCVFTAQEEREFLRDHLRPALRTHGMGDTEVFIWDHNKERLYERVRDVMDESVRGLVDGAAFHWYSGEHFETLDLVRRQYPELKLIASESCIEYLFHDREKQFDSAAMLVHELMGDLNHGICAFYDWNLLLDENGGPNHVGNWCHAPFLYDTQAKKLRPQLLQRYFNHFSHYIAPGAVRIGLSRYTDALEAAAFRNPDGGVAVVLFNRGGRPLPVNLRLEGRMAQLTLPAETVASVLISPA